MAPWQAIDHLMLRVEQAEPLFDALHRDLGLPIGWPLQRAAFATYGWIGVGNTQIEIWAAASNSDLPMGCALPLVHGFALDPSLLETDLALLRERGLRHRLPRNFSSPDAQGVSRSNFTNAVVEDLSSPTCCVFYCDWAPGAPIAPWPSDATADDRRALQAAALAVRQGGVLGVTGLRRVTLQTPDVAATEHAWRTALDTSSGPLLLAPGVQLILEFGPRHQISALHIGVRDAAAARAALGARNWLGAVGDDGAMRLKHPACAGLALWMLPATA
jgi:hypothetical protein